MKKPNYQYTMYACFTGYIVQAVINNFAPLLFLTFQSTYDIPLSQITFLVTFNFGLQLLIDLVSAAFIDKIGYRISIVAAHILSAVGLVSLAFLSEIFPNPFTGLLTAVMIYAVGGGLLEVLVSPIVEACPSKNKKAAMSLLHSFYCWGHVGVVLLSTLFFALAGINNWRILAVIWAVIPAVNAVVFTRVPLASLIAEGERGLSLRELLTNRTFWVMVILMLCAGASEQSVSQWASTFAENGLHVSKTIGDLTGPMFFAVCMGLSRVLYSRKGEQLDLPKALLASSLLCVASYLLISLSPLPALGLLGCGICGFSVGILWPGTFSLSAAVIRRGGTALFALLALAGDLGCSLGPTVVGRVSGLANGTLQIGILAAGIFPLVLAGGVLLSRRFLRA